MPKPEPEATTDAHLFVQGSSSTTMTDRVVYAVPGGVLTHRLFVERDVTQIFAFRRQVLAQLLGRP